MTTPFPAAWSSRGRSVLCVMVRELCVCVASVSPVGGDVRGAGQRGMGNRRDGMGMGKECGVDLPASRKPPHLSVAPACRGPIQFVIAGCVFPPHTLSSCDLPLPLGVVAVLSFVPVVDVERRYGAASRVADPPGGGDPTEAKRSRGINERAGKGVESGGRGTPPRRSDQRGSGSQHRLQTSRAGITPANAHGCSVFRCAVASARCSRESLPAATIGDVAVAR